MNGRPFDEPATPGPGGTTSTPSDELLATHLRRRGDRPAPAELTRAVLARVAETTPERRWRLTLATWRPRLALAAGTLTVVLVASLLLVAAPAPHLAASPSPSSSSPVVGPSWDPTVRALTPPEFLRILDTHPAPGTVLIVDDQIVELLASCASADYCPIGKLVNAGLAVSAPPGGHLPETPTAPIAGPLAIQVGEDSRLVFLGGVVSSGLRLAFKAQDLAKRSAMGGLFVIPAWIYPRGPFPCPSVVATPMPLPTSELGLAAPRLDFCAGPAYLTDTDPGLPPYEFATDPLALAVPREAFAPAAPDGGAFHAVFLVRDWAGYGEVLAQLQPIPIPSNGTVATPTPTAPAAADHVMAADELVGRVLGDQLPVGSIVVASIPASAVTVLSPTGAGEPENANESRWVIAAGGGFLRVDGIAKGAPGIAGTQAFLVEPSRAVRALGAVTPDGTAASLFIVHGWLRMGPAVPCPRPAPAPSGTPPLPTGLLGQALAWSQCPGMWIVPSAVDPWAGPPNNVTAPDGSGSITLGDRSVLPAGTLHAQDEAGSLIDSGPTEGVWLVRLALSNDCPPWAFCVFVPAGRPATGVSWYEVVGPVAAPHPDAVEQRPSPTPAP